MTESQKNEIRQSLQKNTYTNEPDVNDYKRCILQCIAGLVKDGYNPEIHGEIVVDVSVNDEYKYIQACSSFHATAHEPVLPLSSAKEGNEFYSLSPAMQRAVDAFEATSVGEPEEYFPLNKKSEA